MDVQTATTGSRRDSIMLRASALSLICIAVALLATACGESGSAGAGDPVSLVPAGAAV
jgi:hypothetical protein